MHTMRIEESPQMERLLTCLEKMCGSWDRIESSLVEVGNDTREIRKTVDALTER
jgi:hypothetical protein